MEELCFRLHAGHFLPSKQIYADLGVLALLIGGSTVYDSHPEKHGSIDRDIDGAVVVDHRHRLPVLFAEHRSYLQNILKITTEECCGDVWPSIDDEVWSSIDAVRYAGFNSDGQKKSFKFVSLEHFYGTTRSMNILSFKDRRLYDGITVDGRSVYRLQQGTRTQSGLTILHDPWLFEGICGALAFGVTADLLLTGMWIMGGDTVGIKIQTKLLQHFGSKFEQIPECIYFSRSYRFNLVFRAWLESQYSILSAGYFRIGQHSPQSKTPSKPIILYGMMPEIGLPHNFTPKGEILQLSNQISLRKNDTGQVALRIVKHVRTPFSSNSICCIVECCVDTSAGAEEYMELFCKHGQPEDQAVEHANGLIAAKYFPLVQLPRVEDGLLLYPVFSGKSEADEQLCYRTKGTGEVLESILDIEMRKCEDMLSAYQRSLRTALTQPRSSKTPAVHRFFHERLHGYRRLQEFYGSGFCVDGKVLDFDDFTRLPIEIDGVDYPCLSNIHMQANEVLHPARLASHPVTFGLGDAHGGNVLCNTDASLHARRPMLYIDYEASGFHPPLLDIAKQFYNDVFFDTLYPDYSADCTKLEVSIEDGRLCLSTTRVERDLPTAILHIKRRFLIEPLFQVASRGGMNLDEGMPMFTSALFACALLTRNFSNDEKGFMDSLCHAVMLSQAETLPGLFDICITLLGS